MKELHIITVVPGQLCFAWECEVLINSLRDKKLSDNLSILIEKETSEEYINYWRKMQSTYEEVHFSFWSTKNVENLKKSYLPIIRPNILKQYFKYHTYLEDACIFYIDSDILINENINFAKFSQDNINYCSKTNYIGAKYFESKKKDVVFFKQKQYEKIDTLGELCKRIGIDKKIVIDNEENTGGCQYLLKNIDSNFWASVEEDTMKIRLFLQTINSDFFLNENQGFQSWCSDMWAVLWNIWKKNGKTKCPSELDFSWYPTPIEEWDNFPIYHNAGTTGHWLDKEKTKKCFNKSDPRFRMNIWTPFDDIDFGEIAQEFCGYKYFEYIKSIKNPVCVTNGIKKY